MTKGTQHVPGRLSPKYQIYQCNFRVLSIYRPNIQFSRPNAAYIVYTRIMYVLRVSNSVFLKISRGGEFKIFK